MARTCRRGVTLEEPVSEMAEEEQGQLPPAYTVCIDPGHQNHANDEHEPIGPGFSETIIKVSQGTQGVITGIMEYELNLQASLLLKEILEERGIEVVMTRTVNDIDISNKERAEMANGNKAHLLIRIHADWAPTKAAKGAHVIIPDQHHPIPRVYLESEKAAEILINHLEEKIHVRTNSLNKRGDISGFYWTQMPVVLLEMGFMTNPEEDQMMADPSYQRKLMEITANAIEEYLTEATHEKSPM